VTTCLPSVLCHLGSEPKKEHDEIVDLTQGRKGDGARHAGGRRRPDKGARDVH